MAEKYTDDELLDRLTSLADELGRPPTAEEMEQAEDYPSPHTYKQRFGSWNAAKAATGFEIDEGERYSEEELVEHLVSLADELGRSPSGREMEAAEGHPSRLTYIDRFGSWNAAKAEAGLETFSPPEEKTYSRDELLDKLGELAADLGRVPTTDDINAADEYPSSVTYHQRFGSWSQAKKAAELIPENSASDDQQSREQEPADLTDVDGLLEQHQE